MEAVSYNQREAVSLLVKQRHLDLYKRDFSTGDTALHIAVKKNYIHIVEILLQAGELLTVGPLSLRPPRASS